MNRVLLNHYHEDVTFQKLLEEVHSEHRPSIPQWRPQATQDENARLIEEIKFAQAQQQGFDLLYRILFGA